MDKNTITGLALIFVILVTFSYFNKPSQSEVELAKRQHDSTIQVEAAKAQQAEVEAKAVTATLQAKITNPPSDSAGVAGVENDLKNLYGVFYEAAKGTEDIANNITGVASAARETTQAAVDTQGAARGLSELASQLQGLVNRSKSAQ